jgi:hypothetical protein
MGQLRHHHHPVEILRHLLIPQMLVVMLVHIHQIMLDNQEDQVVAAAVSPAEVQVLELRDKEILEVQETLLVEIQDMLEEAVVARVRRGNQLILVQQDLRAVMDFNTHNLMHH